MGEERLPCDRCKGETPHAILADEELGQLAQCRHCGTVQSVTDGSGPGTIGEGPAAESPVPGMPADGAIPKL